jgi:membrane protein implicated in regulation of membrane protease activity
MSVLKESTVSLLADVLVPTVLSLAFGIVIETLIQAVYITYLAKTTLGTTVYVGTKILSNSYRRLRKKFKKRSSKFDIVNKNTVL